MGALLPKPVRSTVVKRCGGPLFRVGLAEVHGWRKTMEDSHLVCQRDAWGFFGVFDGHGGSLCSSFVARRLAEELEGWRQGPPAEDAGVKDLMLRLDAEFLATGQPGGTTGTFAIVSPPAGDDGQFTLRVGNIGDSRVLLGRTDGSMYEGAGTDGALTTDHKPDHPDERARIERTGGFVRSVQGVARVNGDLAVSRSFGDAAYKQTGGPSLEDRPVSAVPEFTPPISCDSTHFLALVCDGISEGEFPNREVVKLAAEELRICGDKPDPGAAAAAVCQQALAAGSNDNLSCMIVMLGAGGEAETKLTLLPGPFSLPNNSSFRKAYAGMAERAGLSFAEAVLLRYDSVCQDLLRASAGPEATAALRAERAAFGDGPPSDLASGSKERINWFQQWLDAHRVEDEPDPSNMSREQLLEYAQRNPEIVARIAPSQTPAHRKVRVAPMEKLRPAIDETPTLAWVPQLESACGQEGEVVEEDDSDGTAKVLFKTLGFIAWLPQRVLLDPSGERAGPEAGKDTPEPAAEPDAAKGEPDQTPKRQRVS